MMEYRSPVRLVTHAAEPVQPFAPQTISRTKKKLLAEMALQDHQITLDGLLYTRNDVMQLLDGITNEHQWRSHCTIYALEPMLAFLENDVFDIEAFKKLDPYLYDQRFVHFVSPYFAASFDSVSNNLIKQKDNFSLACLMNYKGFILPEHELEGFQKIRVYLDELNYVLKNLAWEKFQRDESVLHFLFDGNWISFLNKLPDSFATTRDEFMRNMLSVIYRFQRKATWYYLHQCCLRLNDIECNPTHKELLKQYEETIRENVQGESRGVSGRTPSSSSGPSTGRIIFMCVWILLIFLRLANGCDSERSPVFPDYTVTQDNYRNSMPVSELYRGINHEKNKRNFQNFLYNMELRPSDGEQVAGISTGQNPFSLIGKLPPQEGDAELTVRNRSGFDAVLFYFHESNYLFESLQPQLYSVYIKNGDSYTMRFIPNLGRFNFAFGKEWIHLVDPKRFAVKNFINEASARPVSLDGKQINTIYVSEYFTELPSFNQTLLLSDYSITASIKNLDSKTDTIYSPVRKRTGNFKAEFVLEEQNHSFVIKASGNLYVLRH